MSLEPSHPRQGGHGAPAQLNLEHQSSQRHVFEHDEQRNKRSLARVLSVSTNGTSLDLHRPRRRSHGAPSLHRHSAVGSNEASSQPRLQSCLHPWPWDARAVVRFGPSAASEPSTSQGIRIPSHSGGPAAPRENEVLACSTAAGV